MPDGIAVIRSTGPFEGWIRGAVTLCKYHGEWGRAQPLAERLARVVADLRPFDALVPVPLHPSRYRQRGFNQSLLLAQHVAAALGIAAADILIRTRRTDAQVNLGALQRVANVQGTMVVKPGTRPEGRTYVLIDDVITTGSTLAACAEALMGAGATTVKAATVAREL
jgi:ComF family protein